MPKVTKVRRGRVRGGTCSSYSSCPYSRTSWRDCPKSPRGVHHSALRASETMLFGPFWPPYTGQIHAQSVASTLFGQSRRNCLENSWTSLDRVFLYHRAAIRVLYSPFFRPIEPQSGAHPDFPNSFGRCCLGSSSLE